MQQMRLTQSFAGLLTCGLSLMPIAARADVAALFADYDGAQPKRGLAQVMVIGIAEGFDTINDQLKASQHPALYCSPDKLNGDQLMDILRREVEADPTQGQHMWQLIMVDALRKVFPCKP